MKPRTYKYRVTPISHATRESQAATKASTAKHKWLQRICFFKKADQMVSLLLEIIQQSEVFRMKSKHRHQSPHDTPLSAKQFPSLTHVLSQRNTSNDWPGHSLLILPFLTFSIYLLTTFRQLVICPCLHPP